LDDRAVSRPILPRFFRRFDGWVVQPAFMDGKIGRVVKEDTLDLMLFAPGALGIESS
jgi:hypothetical protein